MEYTSEQISDFEFTLNDRLMKIESTIEKYGEEQFSISFSGGKDSCVLSALVDEALPGNRIPRVYANTGIEYNEMVKFVKSLQAEDDRIVIIKPSVPIKQMLEKEGYPFKSKEHSAMLATFKNSGVTRWVAKYLDNNAYRPCPKALRYQFSDDFNLKISAKCCLRMKEEPLHRWSKNNNRLWEITGIMRSEGGRRSQAHCVALAKSKNGINKFNPLAPITKDFENWYISKRNIKLCPLYYPPYDFERIGCKGCPFALNLQHDLDTLAEFFPSERKQCEFIWKPVYEEYRRLGYRLKKQGEFEQMTLF